MQLMSVATTSKVAVRVVEARADRYASDDETEQPKKQVIPATAKDLETLANLSCLGPCPPKARKLKVKEWANFQDSSDKKLDKDAIDSDRKAQDKHRIMVGAIQEYLQAHEEAVYRLSGTRLAVTERPKDIIAEARKK